MKANEISNGVYGEGELNIDSSSDQEEPSDRSVDASPSPQRARVRKAPSLVVVPKKRTKQAKQ